MEKAVLTPDAPSLPADKRELRRLMETRRAEAFRQNPLASSALRDRFLKNVVLPPGAVVAGYHARGNEIDTALLIEALRARGHAIALPVMAGRDQPLIFRLYNPGDDLVENSLGISEPVVIAPAVVPDILLVPLLAFDRQGRRLGTGGGYYDRTLAELRQRKAVLAVGLGFACQEWLVIPTGSHDAMLDKVVTEQQVFDPPTCHSLG